MLPLLDPTTIMVMSAVMGAAMSAVLYSAHRSFPAEIGGLAHWAGGLLMLLLAALLFSVHELLPLPRLAVMLMTNAALLCGVGLPMIGTQRFFGVRPAWWLFHGAWVTGTGATAWLLLTRDGLAAPVACFSLIAATFHLTQLAVVVRHSERHCSNWLFGTLMLAEALLAATRGLLALACAGGMAPQLDLLQRGPAQSLYLAMGNFMILLLTVSFMTMATHRLQTILERRSTLDPLTQVLNRRGFAKVYARERALTRRAPRQMALISIDIDYFKAINDHHGHATGDRVLVDITGVIGAALRKNDHVARFGGEEFVVMLPQTELGRARSVAERIQGLLRAPRAGGAGAMLPAYTVSIGIACRLGSDEDLECLLMRADRALYRAKQHGRDRIEVAGETATPGSSVLPSA